MRLFKGFDIVTKGVNEIKQDSLFLICRGAPKGRAAGLQPPKAPKTDIKKKRFCRYDTKSFTRFALKPKSATEIG
jgi:hypothetical protein